jgi:hypothetical protein
MKWIVIWFLACVADIANAQYVPAVQPDLPINKHSYEQYWHKKNLFKHMELGLTLGSTGIGIDLAAPLCEFLQVRAGYDYMFPFQKKFHLLLQNEESSLEAYYDMTAKLTMGNAKLLADIYPFKYNKSWHITVGFYYGPSQVAKLESSSESANTYAGEVGYVQLGKFTHDIDLNGVSYSKGDDYHMKPADDGSILIKTCTNALKPYLGFGYGGRLFPSRYDWKVSVECGALFWGGKPSQNVHDGINLCKDVDDYPSNIDTYIKWCNYLLVYPVLSVRISKMLF